MASLIISQKGSKKLQKAVKFVAFFPGIFRHFHDRRPTTTCGIPVDIIPQFSAPQLVQNPCVINICTELCTDPVRMFMVNQAPAAPGARKFLRFSQRWRRTLRSCDFPLHML